MERRKERERKKGKERTNKKREIDIFGWIGYIYVTTDRRKNVGTKVSHLITKHLQRSMPEENYQKWIHLYTYIFKDLVMLCYD